MLFRLIPPNCEVLEPVLVGLIHTFAAGYLMGLRISLILSPVGHGGAPSEPSEFRACSTDLVWATMRTSRMPVHPAPHRPMCSKREFILAHKDRTLLKYYFETPGFGERIVPMEGMRGFAALLVFFVHFNALFHPYFQPGSFLGMLADLAGSFGHTGVDLFFILSGFLIYGIVLKKHPSYRNFLWRRIRRLYPVFLLVLILYLVLSNAFPSISKLPGSFLQAFLYINANLLMLPGMTTIPAIITVSWSLSYEWFFYLTLPLVISVLGLRRWIAWQRVAFFALLAIAEFVLCSLGMSSHIRLTLFAAGIILWELVDNGVPRILNTGTEYVVTVTFIVSILAIGMVGTKHGETVLVLSKVPNFYAPLLFVSLPLFSLHVMFFDGFLNRIFSWDYLRWMGNISYSYYLIHGLALQGLRLVVNRLFPPSPHLALFDVLLLVACLSFTIFCGAVLFILVEKPLSWPKIARNPRGRSHLRKETLSQSEVSRAATAGEAN